MKRIGVLALQGDFREHAAMMRRCGAEVLEVRKPQELEDLDGLVIPGGESTTIGRLMDVYGFLPAITEAVARGMGIFGTCAGMVLLAREIVGGTDLAGKPQPLLGLIDMVVRRNAFGRQRESFETDIDISALGPAYGDRPFRAVFIRAPLIESVGPGVTVLGRVDGHIVLVRQGRFLAAAFHPELTPDTRIHCYFLEEVLG